MRIGLDAKRAFFNATGLGNYSRSLIASLLRFHGEEEYLLYSPKPPRNRFPSFEAGVGSPGTVRTPQSKLGKLMPPVWRSFGMAGDLARHGVEVYHGLSHEIPTGLRKRGIRAVATIHDLIPLKYPGFYPIIDRRIYIAKLKFVCRNADRIIADSEQTLCDIMAHFNVPRERLTVIPLACDTRFLARVTPAQREIVRARFRLPARYVLYVGTINARKNLLTLVQAFERMGFPEPVSLIAVGNGGSYKHSVEQYVSANRLQERVRFLKVPDADLPAVYQMAEVFAYPSFYEGFGLPILEALNSRVPVITSRGGCFSEVGGPDSAYVNPSDIDEMAAALHRLLSDSALRSRMIESGVRYASAFTEESVADRTWAVYRDVLRSKDAPA